VGASLRDRAVALVGQYLSEGKRTEALDIAKAQYWHNNTALSSELFTMIHKADTEASGENSEKALESLLWKGMSLSNDRQYSAGARALQEFVDLRTAYLRPGQSGHATDVLDLYGGGYAGISIDLARLKVMYGLSKPTDSYALKELEDALTVMSFEKEYQTADSFSQIALDTSVYDVNAGEDPWNN